MDRFFHEQSWVSGADNGFPLAKYLKKEVRCGAKKSKLL